MSPRIAVATLCCVVIACALVRLPPRLHPSWSARLLVTAAIAATLAVAASVSVVAAAFALQVAPSPTLHLPAAPVVIGHAPVSRIMGVTTVAAVGLMSLSALRRIRSTWRERRVLSSAQQVVLDSAEPLAYSLPGRDGGILLSRGLRSGLSRPELRVVIEHEISHLRHRHHRYLLAGTICAAMVPFLRGVDRQIRFAVERWADEDAARAVGDRHLVAATIARVALDGTSSAVLAFSGSGVLERVEAMLDEPPVTSDLTGATLLATTGITASTMTAPALQVHHWIGSLPS